MRFHRLASVTFTVALGITLVPALAYEAMPYGTVSHARVRSAGAGSGGADSDRPFGAACRIGAEGSRVTAYCHNPYPDTDHVSLHIECLPWWDLDSDSVPVAVGPAQTVRLTGRCWKEVRAAWISHRKAA